MTRGRLVRAWLRLGWLLFAGAWAALLAGCGAEEPPAPLPPPGLQRITMTPTATATATPTPPCWLGQAQPHPPGTPVPAGQPVTLSWTLANQGHCPWPEDLRLQGLVAATPIFEASLGQALDPGATLTWQTTAHAPQTPGTAQVALQAIPPEGPAIPWTNDPSLALQVYQPPTPTPTPTVTPGPPVYKQGIITVEPGDLINFDDEGPDFLYDGDEILHYHPLNHIVVFGYLWPLDMADCYHYPYGSRNAVQNPEQHVGATFCYTTDQARVGMFRLEEAVPTENGWRLVIRFITWAAQRPRP